MNGASGPVAIAADQAATAMSNAADKYATAPNSKPSRSELDKAVKQLTSATAPGRSKRLCAFPVVRRHLRRHETTKPRRRARCCRRDHLDRSGFSGVVAGEK